MSELVERLVEFEKGYDWYGYRDCFDSDDDARASIAETLGNDPAAIIGHLLDAIEEMAD